MQQSVCRACTAGIRGTRRKLLQHQQQQGPSRGAPRPTRPWQRSSSSSTSTTRYNLASTENAYITLWKEGRQLTQRERQDAVESQGIDPEDMVVYPDFLDEREQAALLGASLQKLDSMAGRAERKRRREYLRGIQDHAGDSSSSSTKSASRQTVFLPDEVYDFQERHFDGVISGYRESTLTDWPEPSSSECLRNVLSKFYSLMPDAGGSKTARQAKGEGLRSPPHLLTHLLHLSSTGYILPHVDNISASAGTILGVCLGTRRYLELERQGQDHDQAAHAMKWRIRLDAGCAYMQRGKIRYEWAHSIPLPEERERGQRLSVMIRDRLKSR